MNKRFASFLLTGKIAALPLFAEQSLASLQNISSQKAASPQFHASPARSGMRLAQFEEHSRLLFANTFVEKSMPRIMNLVINGLHDKDEVLIVMTHKKTIPYLKTISPRSLRGIKAGIIVSHFAVSSTPLSDKSALLNKKKQKNLPSSQVGPKAVSLPIDLSVFSHLDNPENTVYLHIFVANNAKPDKAIVYYSDVVELKAMNKSQLLSQYTEDCTVYTCP
jgi:hypothetical protein